MIPSSRIGVLLACACTCAGAQDVFRCTGPDGRITYQQAKCPWTDAERKVDVTPANPSFDPSSRERALKQEEALDRRLEAREVAERAERKEREERDARERMVAAQEQRARAAEQPVYVVPAWGRFWRRPADPSVSLSTQRRTAQDNRP